MRSQSELEHIWIKTSVVLKYRQDSRPLLPQQDEEISDSSATHTTSSSSPLRKLMMRKSVRSQKGSHWGWVRAVVYEVNEVLNLAKLFLYDEPNPSNTYTLDQKKVTLPLRCIQDEINALRVNPWAMEEMMSRYDDRTLNAHLMGSDSSLSALTANTYGAVPSTPTADRPPDDVLELMHVHEPSLVLALKRRFEGDEIYTNTGPILLALNPFKSSLSNLYSEEVMMRYMQLYNDVNSGIGVDTRRLPPHVFEIAGRAFQSMMYQHSYQHVVQGEESDDNDQKKDQCILVSGESGTGKTVSANYIMKYLAFLSQRRSSSNKRERIGEDIEAQLLYSTNILESFGNARTTHNDNSSRFGKFTEICFTNDGRLRGAVIETYLLEKVRIIFQGPGERNYHIFYQILLGSSRSERNKYFLDDNTPADFAITSRSGTYDRRDGVRDLDMYKTLRSAINGMGFAADEHSDIIGVCCAVLHLSNITFLAVTDDHSKVDESNPALSPMLSLLGLNFEDFNKALTTFSINVGVSQRGEKRHFIRSLSKEKATKGLGAFLKATYVALFDYIVERIQTTLRTTNVEEGNLSQIGVLDIFGFESFDQNSFEQLCINYCNETLQRQFNDFVLKYEQIEYEEEGIDWSFVVFPDNQDVIDLIDKRGSGILDILDDQCITVGGTDKRFWHDMYSKCKDNERFNATYLQIGSRKFEIKHYAGSVEYVTDLFVEKNLDELPREATELLLSSERPLVVSLAKYMRTSDRSSATVQNKGRISLRKSIMKSKATVSGQFIDQLRQLRYKIDRTNPHYIRCVKPNNNFIANEFDLALVLNQLRYAGVLEAIRVSRAGFPQRFSMPYFVDRYRFLLGKNIVTGDLLAIKQACSAIIKSVSVRILSSQQTQQTSDFITEGCHQNIAKDTGIQVGKTKVFITRDAFRVLESMRQQKLNYVAVIIQARVRSFLQRRKYLDIYKAVLTLQCFNRRLYYILRKQRRDAKLFIALWTQKTIRGVNVRKSFGFIISERKERQIRQKEKAAVLLQCLFRCYIAKQKLHRLNMEAIQYENIKRERDALRLEVIDLRGQLHEKNMTEASIASDKEELSKMLIEIKRQAIQLEDMISPGKASQSRRHYIPPNSMSELSCSIDTKPEPFSPHLQNQKDPDNLKSATTSYGIGVPDDSDITSNDEMSLSEYRKNLTAKLLSRRTLSKNEYSIVSPATVMHIANRLEMIVKRNNLDGNEVDEGTRKELDFSAFKKRMDSESEEVNVYRDILVARNRMNEQLVSLDNVPVVYDRDNVIQTSEEVDVWSDSSYNITSGSEKKKSWKGFCGLGRKLSCFQSEENDEYYD